MVINENKVIIGNLKMNGSLAFYQNYFDTLKSSLKNLKHVTIGICLPYPYLFQAEQVLSGSSIQWGSQNVGKFLSGAHTGEVSASMLRDFSSTYVIVGHSERNTAYCESEENIADKFQMVKEHGMTPVLCVGETLIERDAGIMESVVKSQLEALTKTYSLLLRMSQFGQLEPTWLQHQNKPIICVALLETL